MLLFEPVLVPAKGNTILFLPNRDYDLSVLESTNVFCWLEPIWCVPTVPIDRFRRTIHIHQEDGTYMIYSSCFWQVQADHTYSSRGRYLHDLFQLFWQVQADHTYLSRGRYLHDLFQLFLTGAGGSYLLITRTVPTWFIPVFLTGSGGPYLLITRTVPTWFIPVVFNKFWRTLFIYLEDGTYMIYSSSFFDRFRRSYLPITRTLPTWYIPVVFRSGYWLLTLFWQILTYYRDVTLLTY